jgi:D-arabinose 1-dehydrogenase-like Zn-dependent alcohol dehydrogenase
MRAMVLEGVGLPLQYRTIARPRPSPGQVLVKVAACGVCRTDLHVIDGDLTQPRLPIIPGHEIVGRVEAIGAGVEGFTLGDRVGIPWLGHTCGQCSFCRHQQENLCDAPLFTGYQIDGGYAAIIFAPVGELVPLALATVRKGGTVVLGGIHMSEIPAMPYRLLWGERTIRSVANLTRDDAREFIAVADRTPIRTQIVPTP